jgi:hypothetical protein
MKRFHQILVVSHQNCQTSAAITFYTRVETRTTTHRPTYRTRWSAASTTTTSRWLVGYTASDYQATIYQSVRCSIGASLSPKFEEEEPAAPEGNLENGREGVFYLNHGDAGRRASCGGRMACWGGRQHMADGEDGDVGGRCRPAQPRAVAADAGRQGDVCPWSTCSADEDQQPVGGDEERHGEGEGSRGAAARSTWCGEWGSVGGWVGKTLVWVSIISGLGQIPNGRLK